MNLRPFLLSIKFSKNGRVKYSSRLTFLSEEL
jgi:hypothetical protein